VENQKKGIRTVICVRHGHKAKDGVNITPECLQDIRENGIPCANEEKINRIHRGTTLIRTGQTADAYKAYLVDNGILLKPDIDPDPAMAPEDMIPIMFPNGAVIPKPGQTYFATWVESSDRDNIQQWKEQFKEAFKDLFMNLDDEDICLFVYHTPLMELLHTSFNDDDDASIKEMEGIKFIMDKDGKITSTLLQ
jgi:hypothetical protein